MKKGEVVSAPQETKVENPVFSVIPGKEFRFTMNDNAAMAVLAVSSATAACFICGGADAAVRLGIEIVDKLLK